MTEDQTVEETPLTEEDQKAAESIAQAAAIANRLIANDPRYIKLVASMLASRQLYAMCLYELERLCEDTNFRKATKQEDEPDLELPKKLPWEQLGMLKEILINSAAVQSQQPFDENALFQGMAETVFPWMQSVVALHTDLQAAQRTKEFRDREDGRVARKVAFGVKMFELPKERDCFLVARDRPIMFVGHSPVVRWLIDHISEHALEEGNGVDQIIRLNSGGKPKFNHDRIAWLHRDDWAGITADNSAFQERYKNVISHQLHDPADLLIVDDLLHSRPTPHSMVVTTQVNEAQKKFKRWAESAGCLLVGCVQLSREIRDNDLNTPDFETLRIYNTLRVVYANKVTMSGEFYYQVFVGRSEVAYVPAAEFEEYTAKKIITP